MRARQYSSRLPCCCVLHNRSLCTVVCFQVVGVFNLTLGNVIGLPGTCPGEHCIDCPSTCAASPGMTWQANELSALWPCERHSSSSCMCSECGLRVLVEYHPEVPWEQQRRYWCATTIELVQRTSRGGQLSDMAQREAPDSPVHVRCVRCLGRPCFKPIIIIVAWQLCRWVPSTWW